MNSPDVAPLPLWFREAIDTPYRVRHVRHKDCTLEYYQWGHPDKPLLLLIHGNGGHANWWDFIAPFFADRYCVCALHLAGMGNSGWRDEYHFDGFAEDIIAVADDSGHQGKFILAGHSMGGIVALRTAENHPARVQALIIIDSPLIFRRSEDASEQHKPPPPARFEFKGKKYYPDQASAIARYHLVPPQPCANKFLVDHVARHSVRQYPEGWSWKFDDGIYFRLKRSGRPPFDLDKIHCPLAYIHGGESALVPRRVFPDIHQLLKDKGPIFEIPTAHHHVMLDEPLQLIERIGDCLQSFRKNA